MAFGWLKKIGSGAGKVIRVTDQVGSSPLGGLLSGLPIVGTALSVVHAADQLFPQSSSGELKKKAALDALKAQYPGVDAQVLSLIIENSVASLNALKVAQAQVAS